MLMSKNLPKQYNFLNIGFLTSLAILIVVTLFIVTGECEEIIIDEVDGLYAPGMIFSNSIITFTFRLSNESYKTIWGSTNGFRIYTPDTAEWVTSSANFIDDVFLGLADQIFINEFSVNGQGADTLGLGTVVFFTDGIYSGFNEQVWQIQIGPISSVHGGKHICIDSSFYPPNQFLWSLSDESYVPTWGGPYCYEIKDTTTLAPDSITVSGKLSVFDHYFLLNPRTHLLPNFKFDVLSYTNGQSFDTLLTSEPTKNNGEFEFKLEKSALDFLAFGISMGQDNFPYLIVYDSLTKNPMSGIWILGEDLSEDIINDSVALNFPGTSHGEWAGNAFIGDACEMFLDGFLLNLHLSNSISFEIDSDPSKLRMFLDTIGTGNDGWWAPAHTNPYSEILLTPVRTNMREPMHELGHQIHYQLLGRDKYAFAQPNVLPAVEPHYFSLASNINQAFLEGFAEFIESLENVRERMRNTSHFPWLYSCDTENDTADIECNNWWISDTRLNEDGSIVEGSVASILLDIYDDKFTPETIRYFGKDDEPMQDPDFFLNVIFDVIGNTADSATQDKVVDIIKFREEMFDSTIDTWWQREPLFRQHRASICGLFEYNHACGGVDSSSYDSCDCSNSIVDYDNSTPTEPVLPTTSFVEQNYPNPFNSETSVRIFASLAGNYTISITNILGQLVWSEELKVNDPGYHRFKIELESKRLISSGIYLYKVVGPNLNQARKMVYLK